MQGPFSALYAKYVDQREIIEDLAIQIERIYATLRDSKTGLLYHAWDESRGMRWSDLETGLSPHFWGRALGWYAMAVVDIIAIISTDDPLSDPLKKILNTLMGDILAFQQPDGMFYQVVDRSEAEGNYKETSASAMFGIYASEDGEVGNRRRSQDSKIRPQGAGRDRKTLFEHR